SAGGGWAHRERKTLEERGPADLLLALALTHHLALPGQVPFIRQAEYFARLSKHVIVEFIAPEDPKVIPMLQAQPDLRANYTRENFEAAFGTFFTTLDMQEVIEGKRSLYLMRRKDS